MRILINDSKKPRNHDVNYLPPEPNPTRTNFPCSADTGKERIDLRIACTAPRGSAKERNPRSFLPIRGTLTVKGEGEGQVFRAPLKFGGALGHDHPVCDFYC